MRWVVWGAAILFYFYEFIIRVMPSVMSKELMSSFHISATGFGLLAASYMYAYAPMQLPIGVLMDRYGAHRLLTVGALLCGFGSLLFGWAEHLFIAEVGRFLTGMGSSFGFIGFIYISNHWFPATSAGRIMGFGNSLGLLGAICGQGPVAHLVNGVGWRDTSYIIGIAGFIIAGVILLVIRNDPAGMTTHYSKVSFKTVMKHYKTVVLHPQTWVIAMVCGFLYFPVGTFAGLWCVPYLEFLYGVDNAYAGYAASCIFVGWILGGPISGHFSDRYNNRKFFYIFGSFFVFLFFCIIVYFPPKSIYLMFALLFAIGLLAGASILTFRSVVALSPDKVKGSAITFINFLAFVGASICQPLVGWLIDYHWDGVMRAGVPIYAREDYTFAFTFFPAAMLVSLFFSILLKEDPGKPIIG